ncbi:MAG: hypothetical protein R2728_01205 [Chitinophagales bacterium]
MVENIESFWEWFEANESTIIEAIKDKNRGDYSFLVNTLDNLVLSFGRLGWEIGHGKNKPYFLTLSPNNDRELLAVTKKIVAAAPTKKSWEFNPAKLPVDWDLKFEVYDNDFEEHTIDATSWHQVLKQRSDGSINLFLKADNIHFLDHETKMRTVDMVVTSILGEELRIHRINKIKLIEDFEDKHHNRKAPIHILRKQVLGFDEK